jgi:GT2 family glycosyltransferase
MNKRVVICSPGSSFSGKFLTSLTYLIRHLTSKGFSVRFCNTYSRNIYEVRNKCLLGTPEGGEDQKPFDGLDYDYILWIDDDIIFTPNDFEKLYKEDKDVISGLYLMANNANFAAVEIWNEDYFEKHGTFEFLHKEDIKTRMLPFKVEYVGFGFLLFKRGVFEKIKYPWFEPTYLQIKDCKDFSMEDVTLCLKLNKLDIPVYVHPEVVVGHNKAVEMRL